MAKTLGCPFSCITSSTLSFLLTPFPLPTFALEVSLCKLPDSSGTQTWLRDILLEASGPQIPLLLGWVPSFPEASPSVRAVGLGLPPGAGKRSLWIATSLPEVRIYFIGCQPRLHIRVAWGAFKNYHCPTPAWPFWIRVSGAKTGKGTFKCSPGDPHLQPVLRTNDLLSPSPHPLP